MCPSLPTAGKTRAVQSGESVLHRTKEYEGYWRGREQLRNNRCAPWDAIRLTPSLTNRRALPVDEPS